MRFLRRWRRRPGPGALLLLLALLPAACAAPPAPSLSPPLPYPPSVRERILHIARAEWADWGRIVLDADAPRETRPDLPGPESDLSNFPRVLAYWQAVAEGAGPIARNRALYAAALAQPGQPVNLWQEPAWSAAFISFVMRTAGVDRREFPPSAAHAFYLDALLADARAFPATAPFIPHDWTERAPEVGDLICADRSAHPLRHWQERLNETGQFRPMHCDIVVAVAPGVVEAVGGNVADAVTLSRFPTDPSGRLLARAENGPTWFAILENRLGRLPPWNWRTAS